MSYPAEAAFDIDDRSGWAASAPEKGSSQEHGQTTAARAYLLPGSPARSPGPRMASSARRVLLCRQAGHDTWKPVGLPVGRDGGEEQGDGGAGGAGAGE